MDDPRLPILLIILVFIINQQVIYKIKLFAQIYIYLIVFMYIYIFVCIYACMSMYIYVIYRRLVLNYYVYKT